MIGASSTATSDGQVRFGAVWWYPRQARNTNLPYIAGVYDRFYYAQRHYLINKSITVVLFLHVSNPSCFWFDRWWSSMKKIVFLLNITQNTCFFVLPPTNTIMIYQIPSLLCRWKLWSNDMTPDATHNTGTMGGGLAQKIVVFERTPMHDWLLLLGRG